MKTYFTFGSDINFPHPNSYIVIIADTLISAIDYFKKEYSKFLRDDNVLPCSFWYSEEDWENKIKHYYQTIPSRVLVGNIEKDTEISFEVVKDDVTIVSTFSADEIVNNKALRKDFEKDRLTNIQIDNILVDSLTGVTFDEFFSFVSERGVLHE